jgi:hypothetical protein
MSHRRGDRSGGEYLKKSSIWEVQGDGLSLARRVLISERFVLSAGIKSKNCSVIE